MGTLLLATGLVILCARLLGGVFERLRQPRVVGEVLAGVALGTIGLHGVFRPDVVHALTVAGEAALAAYVFGVVADLDLERLRAERRAVTAVGVAAFAVPWLAGAGMAVALGHRDAAGLLFLSTAFAVTAFPVLARIVGQRGLADARPARVSLGAAAAQELVVWPLLGLAVGLSGHGSPGAVAARGAVTLAAIVVVARVLAPRLGRVGAAVGLAAAATASQLVGLHVVLGAFVYALALPRSDRRAVLVLLPRRPVELLLPLFFAVAALRVDVGALLSGGLHSCSPCWRWPSRPSSPPPPWRPAGRACRAVRRSRWAR